MVTKVKTCKNEIDGGVCGMVIKWRYEYGQVPAGQKNVALNPDGTNHWSNCKKNQYHKEYIPKVEEHANQSIPEQSKPDQVAAQVSQTKSERAVPVTSSKHPSPGSGTDLEGELKVEFETADSRLQFDRTFKLIEITLSKTRKANEKTIAQLPPFENLSYFVAGKIECELGADMRKICREKFAEISLIIEDEIQMDRLRLSGLDPHGDLKQ
jgi:hypothetical protein